MASARCHYPKIVLTTVLVVICAIWVGSVTEVASAAPASQQASKTKRRRPPGVRGMFEAAQELFDAGKYNDALAAYGALLRKYPAYEPAAIQIAKTLYRMDKIKDAYGAFAHINPQHLDAETSYEFGWSFYTNKVWDGALYGFSRVPKGHALFDLANYYGAICAIKLKKYEDAADMLEKAVVLPDKLAKSRSLYSKHVQALLLLQQQSALAKDRNQEKDALAQSALAKKRKAEAPPLPAAPTEYVHQGFKSITKSAEIKYTYEHQYYDNQGLAETNYDSRVANFDLLSGVMRTLPSKLPKGDSERQGVIGLQLTLGAEDRITHGREQRILIDESDEDLTRRLNKDLGVTDLKTGVVGAEPWIEFPLPENFWLAFGGEINFSYPDFGRGGRTGYRRGYSEINGKAGTLTYGADGGYKEILDSQTKATSTIVGGSVYASGNPMPKLTLKAKATYEQDDYLQEELNLDGPDTITGGEVTATQELPLGATFAIRGGYQYQANYIFHAIPSFGAVAADGQVATGKVTLAITPVPYFSASVSQLIQNTRWHLLTEAAKDQFEANVPNYLEDLVAWASINLAF